MVINLWIVSIFSGCPVNLFRLKRLHDRGIEITPILEAYINVKKGGLKIKFKQLEDFYISGINLKNVIIGMLKAQKLDLPLTLDEAIQMDSKGIDIIEYLLNRK